MWSLRSLSHLAGSTKSEVLAMAACLADPDVRVRRMAASAINYLGLVGVDAKAAVPALEAALGDSDQNVQGVRAMALGRIGSKRPSTVAGLARILGQGRIPMDGYGFAPPCRWA